MTLDLRPRPRAVLGRLGFALGAAALLAVLALGQAGPFATGQDSTTFVETPAEGLALIGDMVTGEARAARWTVDRALAAGAAGCAGLAVILGLAGILRRERAGPALAGALLGALAMALPLFGLLGG